MPELSIVIPVYNNEKSLEVLVAGIQRSLDKVLSYQLILINDGSSDKSWEIIQGIVKNYSGTSIIQAFDLKKNYGQENAKMAGLKNATGNYVVFLDADCQHNPEHIFALLEKCKEGYDVCYANFNNAPLRPFKRLGSWFYNYLATKLLLKPKGIYLSSYNLFTKDVLEYIVAHVSPLVNIDAIILQKTKNVTQIFVTQGKSLNTKTNYSAAKMIGLFFKLLPGFSALPVRIIFFLGLVLSSIGTLLLITKIIFQIKSPDASFFIGGTNLLIICIGGLVLFSMGIIGEYIGKIYTMLNGTQQYEIHTRISSDRNDKK